MNKEEVIALLGLKPLPGEGGYFAPTYRSSHEIPRDALSSGYSGPRPLGGAIYFLIDGVNFSAIHRLRGDEIWHFYLGDPVEMLLLDPDGTHRVVTLGVDLHAGRRPQVIVPGGVWQGARLASGGEFALLGTTMAPAFDEADFELGKRVQLMAAYPQCVDHIEALTRMSEHAERSAWIEWMLDQISPLPKNTARSVIDEIDGERQMLAMRAGWPKMSVRELREKCLKK